MRNPWCVYSLVIAAACLAVPRASAQTVAVSPTGYFTIAVNQSLQFTATVTGLSNTGVVWSAGGVVGGNATAGTISATGLYTAPASLPGQNPVTIAATSVASNKIHGSTYAYLIGMGPTITSISPNPLPVGSYTVTIQGSGFMQYASVTNNGVQLSTSSVTSGTITASGWQGSVPTATICVTNPGTACSNSLTVPVGAAGPPTYSLTVVNGSPNGGSYKAGTVVNISANAPPAGQIFTGWSGANVANVNASSTSIVMPASGVIVTANYGSPTVYTLTVSNGTINATGLPTGSFLPGTVVAITANAPPANQFFQNWSGAAVANANSPATTVTMPAASVNVIANDYTPAPLPFPVSSHPRLWITPADLPRLQSWANSNNPIYGGMQTVLATAISSYYQSFPGAALDAVNPTPASPYPDLGDDQGYAGLLSEENAMILAFHSLIDPNAANRIKYAQAARNLMMYALNQAALGHSSGVPFRDQTFGLYNRASFTGHEWPLIVDWIYNATNAGGTNILTAADKAVIQNVFLQWSSDCLTASVTGGDHPFPVGTINSLALLPNGKPYRMASNNYYLGHARNLTMMALALDPSDDPPVNPLVPPSQLGNTVRSYILDATGAWLYQDFAMMGDPQTVAQALNVPNNPTGAGFGLSSGGLPPEGFLYGDSFSYILGQLLALQTAGFNDPSISGPQIALIGAPVWDRYITGYLSSMTPSAQVFAFESWNGPEYQFAGYGDMLRAYVTPDMMRPFALITLLDAENGQTNHQNAARWFSTNGVEGGAAGLLSRVGNPWTWGATSSIFYYMLFDPAAPAPTDPRQTYPTLFYDAPAARIVAHTDWSAMGTLFSYKASWESINHQQATAGQFELLRKGEWLTKEMSNYDNNWLGQTSEYHNTLGVQNWSPSGTPPLSWWETNEWATGSQFALAMSAGDPTTITSSGPGYVHASSNLTNLYNRPNTYTPSQAAIDVTQATRSIVWLNGDFIVIYDRATTQHSGLFKQFNLCLVNPPVIAGNTAVETLASGQQLFMQTLLPLNASMTAFNGGVLLNTYADTEPTRFIYQVADPTNPADTRFLHVLQGGDAGASMVTATYLQSTAGTSFDGAVFGSNAVYFPVSATTSFTGATLPAPAGVHTMMITGLTPNASYMVTVATGSVGITTGPGQTVDAAGVLVVTF